MNATIIALLGYISWTILLLVALATYRTVLVVNQQRQPNNFKSDGSDLPGFGLRLTRAQANCAESFVIIGGIMLVALATGSAVITDGLAWILLAARVGQSMVHVISTSVLAVQIRFALFLVQIGICLYWIFLLAQKFCG